MAIVGRLRGAPLNTLLVDIRGRVWLSQWVQKIQRTDRESIIGLMLDEKSIFHAVGELPVRRAPDASSGSLKTGNGTNPHRGYQKTPSR